MEHPGPLTPEEARLRPTYAVVRLSRLRDHLAAIKSHAGRAQVMAVLKANAYGHGLASVARAPAPLPEPPPQPIEPAVAGSFWLLSSWPSSKGVVS